MKPVVTTVTLVTEDGVPIDAVHLPAPRQADPEEVSPPEPPADPMDLAIVMAHGFTQSWQRPMVWQIARWFNRAAGVLTFDFRGHGRSGGLSTLGDKEVADLDVAVRYAREMGYARVATVGFSMGASVVIRQAALRRGVDAVVAISGPGWWFYRGTEPMRRVHFVAERRLGRAISRHFLGTRISPHGWPSPDPMPPAEAAALITPTPLLIVHGDRDAYFPPEHGRQLYEAAGDPREFWLLPGFGHAERATDDGLVGRITAWVAGAVPAAPPGALPALPALPAALPAPPPAVPRDLPASRNGPG